MFRTETTSVRMLQTVSVVASLAILLWSLGFPSLNFVGAATLVDISDTLTDSDVSVVSNHTIQFTVPTTSNGIDADAETITVTFPTGFTLPANLNTNDVDLTVDGAEQTLATTSAASTWGVTVSGQDLILEADAATPVAGGDVVIIEVGTNATAGDTGNDQVINHGTPGSYELDVTLPEDSATTHIVILNDVDVTAAVNTVFNFTVGGFASVTGINVNGTSTTATSSATAIPFGTLTAGEIVTAAQLLNVETNAASGFVVTVQQSQDLRSATGADIDGFADGAYTNTPSDWAAPGATVGNEWEYGHWGLTTSDDLNGGEFQGCAGSATGCWVAASTTPRAIFENDGPAIGDEANVGSTTVGYQVEITALQEAADDYSTTLTYIATPTF